MSDQKNNKIQFHKEENFNGIRVSPIVSSARMSDIIEYFDNNTILGKELPIILNSENLKNNKCGPREFYVFQTNQGHSMWQGHHMDECYMNELVRGKDDVRLVFDFDIKKSDDILFEWTNESDSDVCEILCDIMDRLSNEIDGHGGVKYGLFTSSREEKISYHIIFENVSIKYKDIPYIITEVIEKFDYSEEDRIYIFGKDGSSWFDMNIYPTRYESVKSLRLVGHAKRCNDIKLFYKKGSSRRSDLYIRHRSSLEFDIIKTGTALICGSKVLCTVDEKKQVVKNVKTKSTRLEKGELLEILLRLNEERRKYKFSVNIMYAIYNTYGEEGKDIFLEFINSGAKDRNTKSTNNWNGIKDNDREDKTTLATVFGYLKEDDYDYFVEYQKSSRRNPIKLFHDIGFIDITADTLYEEISTKVYNIDRLDKDKTKHVDELKDAMNDILFKIKACIAMFKTPQIYYRLKRIRRTSLGEEVIYQNTDKLDKKFYITTREYYTEGKDPTKKSKLIYIPIENIIGQGTKLGIMYNFITFYPTVEPTKDLNTFTGFVGSIERNTSESNYQPILDHIYNIICKSDEKLNKYYLNLMAHSVQKPQIKTKVVPVLVGEQGCGKSILYEEFLVPYVIGTRYTKTVDSIDTVLEKHFNLSETLLLVFEEAMFAGHKKEYNALKHKVTGKQTIVNEKFKDIREVESYLNIVMISNHEHCMPCEMGDRRYYFLRCDDSKKANTEYFNNLATCFNKETGNAFYKFLMNIKLDRIEDPPMTELKRSIINMSKDKLSMFISRIKEGDIDCKTIISIKKIEYYTFEGDQLLKMIGDGHLNYTTMKNKLLSSGWDHKTVRWIDEGEVKRGNRFLFPKPEVECIDADDVNNW
jgi:hypothetical protein